MDSIPSTQLAGIARDVALELGRPWRVEELHAKALEAYPTAKRRAATSGLSGEQAYMWMLRRIHKDVMQVGKGLDVLPFGEEKPAPERIEAAFGTFTAEQWNGLIEGFDQAEVDALLSFIREDVDRLKQKLGVREVGRIEERASLREIVLWVENNRSTLVPISDPFWAHVLSEDASQENREGQGHPAKGVSVSEEVSETNLARLLSKRDMNVSAYEVGEWLKRARHLSFEQYVANVGADDEEKRAVAFIEYWAMIRKKHQRKRD